MKKAIIPLVLLLVLSPAMAEDGARSEDMADGLGQMAIPMLLFTAAGIADFNTSTGVCYTFGEDDGDFMQTFGYDLRFPWENPRLQIFWAAPFEWYRYDIFGASWPNPDYSPNVGFLTGYNIDLFSNMLVKATIEPQVGVSYSMAREQFEVMIGMAVFKVLF